MRQWITSKCWGDIGQLGSDPPFLPSYAPLRGTGFSSASSQPNVYTFPFTHPWSIPGGFKNFYFEIFHAIENPVDNGNPTIDFEVYINDLPSGLKVTVPLRAGSVAVQYALSSARNITNVARIAPGDYVSISRGAGTIPAGFNNFTTLFAWTLTFESDNPGESCYGCSSAQAGLLGATNVLYSAPFTGPSGLSLASLGDPGTYSIVPLEGNAIRIDVRLDVAPGVGASRVYAAYLNNVVQDGSGGTVDTRVTIAGLSTTGSRTFLLPIHVLNKLSVAQLVSGGPAPAPSRVTYSIGIRATTDGQFALGYNTSLANPSTDGTTDYAVGNDGGWAWTTARAPTPTTQPSRFPFSEYSMSIPGPLDAYQLGGLCMDFSSAPGAGAQYAFTTRRALADTPGILTMANTDLIGVGTGLTGFYASPEDRLALKSIGTGAPHTTRTSWTWLGVQGPPLLPNGCPTGLPLAPAGGPAGCADQI